MSTILCYAQRKPGSTEPLYDMMQLIHPLSPARSKPFFFEIVHVEPDVHRTMVRHEFGNVLF